MSEDVQSQLDRLAGTRDAESTIHGVFFREARGYADTLLSAAVKSLVGPSAIANAAIRSAIKCAKAAEPPLDDAHFRALVFTITRSKAQFSARKATADKRDVNRNETFDEARDSRTPGSDVAEVVAAKELAQQITLWILNEADETRRVIRYLGLIEEEPATQIHAILTGLQKQYPDSAFRVPAVRTIQNELADSRERIRVRFSDQAE